MELLVSFEQLNNLIKPYLRKNMFTNNYTLPVSYKDIIINKRLYFEENSNGLFLLKDMDNYYRMYYHLKSLEQNLCLQHEKPIVAEIVYTKDKPLAIELIGFWESCGFFQREERIRFSVSVEDFLVYAKDDEVSFALNSDYEKIVNLLNDSFHSITGFMPSANELKIDIKCNRVLCLKDTDGNISGLLRFGYESAKSTQIWQLAVNQDSRGLGVSKKLLAKWKAIHVDSCTVFRVWTSSKNTVAKEVYKKHGFINDKWQSLTISNI